MKSHFVHTIKQPDKKDEVILLSGLNYGKSAATGAKFGAAAGTVVPGVGNVVGAAAGAVTGLEAALTSHIFGGGSSHKLNSAAYQNAPTDKVTIFNDTKFNGASKSFSPGQFVWLGKSGRDKISSIKIPAGLQVEAWTGRPPSAPSGQPSDNPGEKVTWNSDQSYVGAQWNDHIDTIRVSGTTAQAGTAKNKLSTATAKAKKSGLILPLAIGGGILAVGITVIASKN